MSLVLLVYQVHQCDGFLVLWVAGAMYTETIFLVPWVSGAMGFWCNGFLELLVSGVMYFWFLVLLVSGPVGS